jgi:hypothetical protein
VEDQTGGTRKPSIDEGGHLMPKAIPERIQNLGDGSRVNATDLYLSVEGVMAGRGCYESGRRPGGPRFQRGKGLLGTLLSRALDAVDFDAEATAKSGASASCQLILRSHGR